MSLINKIQLTKKQIILGSAVGLVVLFFILVFVGVIPGRKSGTQAQTITLWGVEDDSGAWRGTAKRFNDVYPNIHVQYKSFSKDKYEKELLDALAAGKGPDVFMFHDKWLQKHLNKIMPFPQEKMSVETFSGLFPQVAEQDFVFGNKVYALPLSIDTLALAYNRDIFDKKGVVFPPEHWNDFEEQVPKIRTFEDGKMTLAAAAIGGTSKSVPHSTDIITLLMLQNDVPIITQEGRRVVISNTDAQDAFKFYLQFGNPEKQLYTWKDSFGDSIDLFANEKVGMIFVYGSELKKISAKNPFLDYAIRPIPQIDVDNPVNVADYWGLAVSSATKKRNAARDFAIFATTDRESATEYLDKAGRPPALRFLINDFIDHPQVGVFAKQALTAKSWPQPNDEFVTDVFDNAIDAVLSGELNVVQALSEAEKSIANFIRENY